LRYYIDSTIEPPDHYGISLSFVNKRKFDGLLA